MLKYFKIENSYSYNQPVVLDFMAERAKKDLWQFVRKTHNDYFLPVVALYGSNAGGKTNLCRAFVDFIHNILTRQSALYSNKPMPYLLTGKRSPIIKHEACFSFLDESGNVQNCVYEYGFHVTTRRFSHESLTVNKEGQTAKMGFTRKGQAVEYIGNYASDNYKQILEDVAKDTNTLLVNALGQTNVGYGISEIFDWCRKAVYKVSVQGDDDLYIGSIDLAHDIASDGAFQKSLSKFVNSLDKSVADIKAVLSSNGESEEPWEDDYEIVASHPVQFDSGSRNIGLPFYMLSNGTKKVILLYKTISRCLDTGGFLVIDELDTMLHPVVFREIVRIFNEPSSNPKNAQLVFAAHNTIVLNREDLRRDQIAIVEKDDSGCSSIERLSKMTDEFGKPIRSDLKYDKAYLAGILGSFPYEFNYAFFNRGGDGLDA